MFVACWFVSAASYFMVCCVWCLTVVLLFVSGLLSLSCLHSVKFCLGFDCSYIDLVVIA